MGNTEQETSEQLTVLSAHFGNTIIIPATTIEVIWSDKIWAPYCRPRKLKMGNWTKSMAFRDNLDKTRNGLPDIPMFCLFDHFRISTW